MLGAYASLAVLCAGSLVIGQAILSLCGWREFTFLAAPVGLAAALVASGIAIKLPGHGTAVAITLALLVLASITALGLVGGMSGWRLADIRSMDVRTMRRRDAERPPGAYPAALLTAAIAVLFASIPFIANGRVGILGVGLVNDDMANHLLIADWLNTRVGQMPVLIHQGYPVGPHSLAAGLSEGLGTGLIQAFAGLTLAIPALVAMVAAGALDGLRRAPRIAAAVLVALPYLAAAYLAQEAFKEPVEALFLLSFALLLPSATTVARAVPLGVIAAGAVYTYSFPGLFWLAGAAAIYLAIALARGTRGAGAENIRSRDARTARCTDAERSPGAHPVAPLAIAAAVGVLLILTAPEWSRMIDFSHFRAFRTSALSSGLGNLRHQLSPLEALGIWPTSEFRLAASDSSHPAAFYAGAAIAAVALGLGLPRWLRRHGPAVPAALASAIAIYVGARLFGTVYTSAKALAIAAPLITLVSLGGLLERAGGAEPREGTPGAGPENIRSMDARTVRCTDAERSPGAHAAALWRWGLALALAAGIALSSFLVLRQAPVAPQDHADQLAELRPLVQGRRVLFLGRDNFVAYELRGARPFVAVRNYYDRNYVRPNLRLHDVFQKFDFDSVTPQTLPGFPFVITTRAPYASGPPPGFTPLRTTPDFVLWKRTAPLGPRHTLAEGDQPGAVLDCRAQPGRRLRSGGGSATVFAATPVSGTRWSSSTVEDGSSAAQALALTPGRWEVSLAYDATRPVRVTAPGLAATVPANLDYRGSVPYYPVGELRVRRRGPVRFTVTVGRPPLAGRILGTKSEAHLGAIAASPAAPSGGPMPGEAERRIPLAAACGRYVDWYRPARGR